MGRHERRRQVLAGEKLVGDVLGRSRFLQDPARSEPGGWGGLYGFSPRGRSGLGHAVARNLFFSWLTKNLSPLTPQSYRQFGTAVGARWDMGHKEGEFAVCHSCFGCSRSAPQLKTHAKILTKDSQPLPTLPSAFPQQQTVHENTTLEPTRRRNTNHVLLRLEWVGESFARSEMATCDCPHRTRATCQTNKHSAETQVRKHLVCAPTTRARSGNG